MWKSKYRFVTNKWIFNEKFNNKFCSRKSLGKVIPNLRHLYVFGSHEFPERVRREYGVAPLRQFYKKMKKRKGDRRQLSYPPSTRSSVSRNQ
jgi:hypothetical protein